MEELIRKQSILLIRWCNVARTAGGRPPSLLCRLSQLDLFCSFILLAAGLHRPLPVIIIPQTSCQAAEVPPPPPLPPVPPQVSEQGAWLASPSCWPVRTPSFCPPPPQNESCSPLLSPDWSTMLGPRHCCCCCATLPLWCGRSLEGWGCSGLHIETH